MESPRTDAEPMAFTPSEFLRGALAAWLWAMAIPSVAWLIMFFPAGWIGTIIIIPMAFLATAAFALPAWLLGWALRAERRSWVHGSAFSTFGVLVGAAATALYFVWGNGDLALPTSAFAYGVNALCGAGAVFLGWRHAVRRALGVSPRRGKAPTAAVIDAATEDELAERLRLR